MMSTILSPDSLEIGEWRNLYRLALFETDKQKLPLRIAEAEHALRVKANDLFSAGNDSDEESQAVDDALYVLQALRHCMEFRTTESAVA